ncbi:hypothetical protein GCM10027598_31520 [Amycolatopsis oliviviridis]|uniref:Uncharacterized protein n=1 Tax=Amycolatopsis oliviviridis TaxID=1471590 RepID=A0ABQ3LRS8_9PSEU|nr:hypothetical protein [Amycolatopsis oliviviridis]GHH24421.1 hypothetical protein GCM10017790_48640 [Amycolatopsis oliviviridis]
MSDLASQPGVIPYVDNHDGERRLLTVDVRPFPTMRQTYVPFVSIDGRQYVVSWGSVTFEVPADRNVHVSVHLQTNYGAGSSATSFASIVLAPHQGPVRLATQLTSQGGSILPVG